MNNESNRKAVKKYAEKTKTYALKYYATDIQESHRLQDYINNTGMSVNSYLKALVKRDLDEKGIAYPDTPKKED